MRFTQTQNNCQLSNVHQQHHLFPMAGIMIYVVCLSLIYSIYFVET